MKKNAKTGKKKAVRKATTEYGSPIYATINASYNKELVLEASAKIIEEAYEYKSVLYLVINSGVPKPPPCLPGQNCNG